MQQQAGLFFIHNFYLCLAALITKVVRERFLLMMVAVLVASLGCDSEKLLCKMILIKSDLMQEKRSSFTRQQQQQKLRHNYTA